MPISNLHLGIFYMP